MLDAHALRSLDLSCAEQVIGALVRGGEANHSAACRDASVDRITGPGRLIATGDLHDNPVHMARLIEAAGLGVDPASPAADRAGHLTLHEIIHPDRLLGGMDFSYRALVRAAALKAAFPGKVHTLLANHELAQVRGSGIVKDGVRVVEAFNAGVEQVFGADAPDVTESINGFIASMPLALICETPSGRILCSHSLPSPAMMARFDATILSRELTEDDYRPLSGSAHMMVWGRGYDADLLEDLVERWGVTMFILGHEHAPGGVEFVPPCALVLNSDHTRGVYLPIDLDHPPSAAAAAGMTVALDRPGPAQA
jgi:hypothetical protein